MNKKIWDLWAPWYERAMKKDERAYEWMYDRIAGQVRNKSVLEIATGPGMLAKRIAGATRSMVATDYSKGMIREAKKGAYSDNLTFEVADAHHVPYNDDSFDVVIIANALHIVPNPEQVLLEIKRVLKHDGLLIAPNFVTQTNSPRSKLRLKLLKLAGIGFENHWNEQGYAHFLEKNGFTIRYKTVLDARVALVYAECLIVR